MTVRVLIRRRIKPANMQDLSGLLIRARTNAMEQAGYIASETLSGCDNANEVLVISTWRHKADWDAYRENPGRVNLEKEFETIMEGPAEYLTYKLGL